MASVISFQPTTELEAVNLMLANVSEAPVADLSSPQGVVELAINALIESSREVQTLGWRFNTEFELPLLKHESFLWTDIDGTTQLIDIFLPPNGALAWTLSEHPSQHMLDVAVRPAKQYDPIDRPNVLYDRARNRDGFPAGERQHIYVDVTWGFDFPKLPQSARRYIAVRAARQMASQIKDVEAVQLTERDEIFALRALKIDQGDTDTVSVFDSPDVSRILGGRPRWIAAPPTRRRYWR